MRAALKRGISKLKDSVRGKSEYQELDDSDEPVSFTGNVCANTGPFLNVSDVADSVSSLAASIMDSVQQAAQDSRSSSVTNGHSAPATPGSQPSHSDSENDSSGSDPSTKTVSRKVVVYHPPYNYTYSHYPERADIHQGLDLPEIKFSPKESLKRWIKSRLSVLKDQISGALLDATPSSMKADVDLKFTVNVSVHLAPSRVPAAPASGPLRVCTTAPEHGHEFLPDSDVHATVDSTLQEIGDALEKAARKKHGVKAYITVIIEVTITATVDALEEGEAQDSDQPKAGSVTARSGEQPVVSSHEDIAYITFEDMIKDIERPLTKAKLEKVVVFVVYGAINWINHSRFVWNNPESLHPYCYARILSSNYVCPHGVNHVLHWSHGPEDPACSDPTTNTVFAIPAWYVGEDGKFTQVFNPDRHAVRVASVGRFMSAYAALPE